MDADKEVQERNTARFVQLIKEAGFTHCEVLVEDPVKVRVSRPGHPRSPAVEFVPREELLQDDMPKFNEVVARGIELAKQILQKPHLKNKNLQGGIWLGNDGPEFHPSDP